MRVFITGATGFIGSHIGDKLHEMGLSIMALKRANSDMSNTLEFKDNTVWLNSEVPNWREEVITFKPDIIIHSAWIGVDSVSRDNWQDQLTNITFLYDLLYIAKKCNVQKFIAFGSQAEYGVLNKIASEDQPENPVSSYGAVKVATHQIAKTFCCQNNIKFFWLKLFSFFGERESKKWLIPLMVNKIKNNISIDLTEGEQKYSYLYIKDFASKIGELVLANIDSNDFIISSNYSISIRELVTKIRDFVNPGCQLNFGAIPMRTNQSLVIQGNSSKFESLFGPLVMSDFNTKLELTIRYYLSLEDK